MGAPLRRRRARAPTPRPARRDGIAPAVGAGRPLSSPERRGGGPARAVRRGPSRARNYSPPASAHRMRRAHPSHPSSRSPVASRGYARARRVSGRPGRHAGPKEDLSSSVVDRLGKGTAGANPGCQNALRDKRNHPGRRKRSGIAAARRHARTLATSLSPARVARRSSGGATPRRPYRDYEPRSIDGRRPAGETCGSIHLGSTELRRWISSRTRTPKNL